MDVLRGDSWEEVLESQLQDYEFKRDILEALKRVEMLPDEDAHFLGARIKEALEIYHKDLGTMKVGEIRIFFCRHNDDIYALRRKMQTIYARYNQRPDLHEKFSFRLYNEGKGIIKIRRCENVE